MVVDLAFGEVFPRLLLIEQSYRPVYFLILHLTKWVAFYLANYWAVVFSSFEKLQNGGLMSCGF